MPQLLNTPALVNPLMNLSTDEKCENICGGNQILMNKIEVHMRHFFKFARLSNVQIFRLTSLISIIDR